MNKDQREIQRKLRILSYADEIGHVAKACRYFGVGRASFYRWRAAYQKHGESGLINRPSIPKQHYNRTPVEIEEKVLHLRSKYHLGSIRIVWYMERYHDIRISESTVFRILKRNGMSRLPRGTRLRKVHTKRYQKHTQANAIDFVDHIIEKFPFRIKEIRTDNGHEFQAKFHWHVEDLGIRHAYIKRATPQLNGKVERSHRSDQQEFYQLLSYKGDVDLEAKLDEWERFYNFHRPHGAFNGKTPYETLREKLQSTKPASRQ